MPSSSKPAAPRGLAPFEMKIYGVNACRALWQNRAADIIRVYVAEERLRDFGPLLKWCARQKKAYHVLTPAELERVAASVHHEGIVFIARAPERLDDEGLLTRVKSSTKPTPLLYLDDVGNPHNIGAMLRIGAHFGVGAAMGRANRLPRMSSSLARMAEGGMEHVPLAGLQDVPGTLKRLRSEGYALVAASGDAKASLYEVTLPPRVIFALGNEVSGLSAALRDAADTCVRIPGTGAVESLNVAVASALLLGEYWRQHRTSGP